MAELLERVRCRGRAGAAAACAGGGRVSPLEAAGCAHIDEAKRAISATTFLQLAELANLVLLCSRHHHLLHSPGWHAKLLPDTTLEITDPQGQVHTSDPPALRPPPPLRE